MKIRFSTYAMPGHVPGEIADLPDDQARAFITRNVAVPIADPAKVETTSQQQPPLETTTVKTVPAPATSATPMTAAPVTPAIDANPTPVIPAT